MNKRIKLTPKNILVGVWLIFSTSATVISLASLADTIVAWSPFIDELVASYRRITTVIWGNIFSLFDLRFPQPVHDYFTINSIFAVSITWGFYNTGLELGFALSNVRDFIKNNIMSLKIEGSSFELFKKRAKEELLNENGKISKEAMTSIRKITRTYGKTRIFVDGLISSIFIILFFILISFVLPFFIKWRDMKNNYHYKQLMHERYGELKKMNFASNEKNILLEKYNTFCLQAADHDREYIKLYHKVFRSSILWHVLAVAVFFMVLVFSDYLYRKLT